MQVKLYIQISPSSLACVTTGDTAKSLEAELMGWASFSAHQYPNYVQLGEVLLNVEIDNDKDSLVQKAVAALRVEQADIRAKAQKECNAVEHKINQLLAIENKPSAPEVVGSHEVQDETDA